MAPRNAGRNCNVCFNSFSSNGENAPFSLQCGHSLCAICWNQMADKPTSPSCPFCLQESASASRNYSLIELLEVLDESEKKREEEGEVKCEICREDNYTMICCDCGSQRQCESCCNHLHLLDQLTFHRRKKVAVEHSQARQKEEEEISQRKEVEKEPKEKEEESKEEEEKEEPKRSKKVKRVIPSPQRKSKQKKKGVSKEGSRRISSIATTVLRFMENGRDFSAFLTALYHTWTDGDCAALLAVCFFDGIGTKISNEICLKWAHFAAEAGSWFGKGIFHYVEKNYGEAESILYPFAKEGNSMAQRCLGKCFCMKNEHKKAFSYHTLSADQGLASGIHNQAAMFLDGQGVEQNVEKAVQTMIQLSDERDWAISQSNIGHLFKIGKGVEVNEKKAVQYLRRSVVQGNLSAINMMGTWHQYGFGVPQSDILAFQHYKLAAERGFPRGIYNLGFCYCAGMGVEKDEGMGIYHYTEAAEGGDLLSQMTLAKRYESGRGVRQNKENALKYFGMAAEQGDQEAAAAVKRLEG